MSDVNYLFSLTKDPFLSLLLTSLLYSLVTLLFSLVILLLLENEVRSKHV